MTIQPGSKTLATALIGTIAFEHGAYPRRSDDDDSKTSHRSDLRHDPCWLSSSLLRESSTDVFKRPSRLIGTIDRRVGCPASVLGRKMAEAIIAMGKRFAEVWMHAGNEL